MKWRSAGQQEGLQETRVCRAEISFMGESQLLYGTVVLIRFVVLIAVLIYPLYRDDWL